MAEVELPTDLLEVEGSGQNTDGQKPVKKHRKRLKKICTLIREQMEFYFSDANLHKDGYVKQLIDQNKDRYVSVSVFSNFNKIRELTTDMKLVVKALSTSEILEVKEGGEYIRRKTAYKEPKDVDDRTIYVESLPREVDHEWLKQTFSQYGKVLYVSLPRYQTTGDIKGFAFIEFETKEAVEKACQSPLDPEDDRATRFPRFNKQLQSLQKQIGLTGEKPAEDKRSRRRSNTSESSVCGEEEGPPAKCQKRASESSDTESTDLKTTTEKDKSRTRIHSAESEPAKTEEEKDSNNKGESSEQDSNKDGAPPTKKRKQSEDKTESKESATEKREEEPKTPTGEPRSAIVDRQKRKRQSEVSESDIGEVKEVKRVRISEQVDVKENVEVSHKKRRNKKKKRKEDRPDETIPPLKVIPKHAWLELRKEYLDLQRSSMKKLKKSLKKIKKRQQKDGMQGGEMPSDRSTKEPGGQATQSKQEEAKKGSARVQYSPGVIIKIDTDQPCMRKELKETLSLVAVVPYVDFQDGDQQGHVRCATPEDALRVIASRPSSFRVSLLQGEEESAYWTKINADREQKHAVKTRNKRKGTQKLMDRAEKTVMAGATRKHIVFDD